MAEKQFPFDEKDVRLHFRLLQHIYLTEIRLLKRGMYAICKIVKDEETFVTICQQWNGMRNIYVGLRDRREGLRSCGRSEDIIGMQSVVLDIDPVRHTEMPSTKKELQSAIKLAELIKKWFGKNGFKEPLQAITGNGCTLYFFLPFFKIDEKNRFEITHKIESFENWVRNNFKKEITAHNCFIDRMYDLPRIIRVIGTYNIKGTSTNKRPWRLSQWLDRKEKREEDEKLLMFILGL